jgi:hypothetical protein
VRERDLKKQRAQDLLDKGREAQDKNVAKDEKMEALLRKVDYTDAVYSSIFLLMKVCLGIRWMPTSWQ